MESKLLAAAFVVAMVAVFAIFLCLAIAETTWMFLCIPTPPIPTNTGQLRTYPRLTFGFFGESPRELRTTPSQYALQVRVETRR